MRRKELRRGKFRFLALKYRHCGLTFKNARVIYCATAFKRKTRGTRQGGMYRNAGSFAGRCQICGLNADDFVRVAGNFGPSMAEKPCPTNTQFFIFVIDSKYQPRIIVLAATQ